MKIETLTKENICELLATTCKKYNENYSKRDSQNPAINSYIKQLDSYDMELPSLDFSVVYAGSTKTPEKDGISLKFVNSIQQGVYFYTYIVHKESGEKFNNVADLFESHPNTTIMPEQGYVFSHFKYVEELDILIGKDYTATPSKNEIKEHDVICVLTRDRQYYSMRKSDGWYKMQTGANAHVLYHNGIYNSGSPNLLTEFKKMFCQTIFNMGANNFMCINNTNSITELGAYKAKLQIKDGPKQRKINELIAKKLPAVNDKFPESGSSNAPQDKTVLQKVEPGLCVVRWILKNPVNNEMLDGYRIYIEGKEIHACKTDNNGKYIRTTISNILESNFKSKTMNEVNPDDLKGTLLEYYGSIINDIPDKYKSLFLFLFIKEPKLEQLFKNGFSKLLYATQAYCDRSYQSYDDYTVAGSLIGTLERGMMANCSEKNINKWLGLNKYQIDKVLEISKSDDFSIRKLFDFIYKIKQIYGSSLNDLDQKTTDFIFDKYADTMAWQTNYRSLSLKIYIDNVKAAFPDKNQIKNIETSAVSVTEYGALRNLMDYYDMIKRMPECGFRLLATSNDEARMLHDDAVALYNLKRDEYEAQKFCEQLVKVKDLEYENEKDDFCVVIPTKPEDLAREGMELHHCVKSYINKVSRGDTNIVFIRKRDDKSKPFFTVEVSNNFDIEQVHGFANRNSDTEPKLNDFVKKWARAKKLKVTNINKVR